MKLKFFALSATRKNTMTSSSIECVPLRFDLQVEDGWPPVATEVLQCRPVGSGYEVVSIPLFVKDLSVGDVISAQINTNGLVQSWRHTSKSEHSTIWVLRTQSGAPIEDVLGRLRAIGCNTVGANSIGMYAVDVPPEVDIEGVDKVLESLDGDEAGVAYPSFRHHDS